jgi:hypothetical protein
MLTYADIYAHLRWNVLVGQGAAERRQGSSAQDQQVQVLAPMCLLILDYICVLITGARLKSTSLTCSKYRRWYCCICVILLDCICVLVTDDKPDVQHVQALLGNSLLLCREEGIYLYIHTYIYTHTHIHTHTHTHTYIHIHIYTCMAELIP